MYFHSAQSGEKVECLRRHPRVSLCCIGDTNRGAFGNFTTEYESAILRGQAAEVTDPEEKQRILRLLCERHTPELMEKFPSEAARSLGRTGVWCIETETITAKTQAVRQCRRGAQIPERGIDSMIRKIITIDSERCNGCGPVCGSLP